MENVLGSVKLLCRAASAIKTIDTSNIIANGSLMAVVHKSVFLGYSAEQMFALVERVEDYPVFLPWCGGVDVRERGDNTVVASLAIHYHGVKQSFTTSNLNAPPSTIKMRLVDGPFKSLDGLWTFKPLRADACKIEFDLHYEFSSRLLESIVGPVFGMITGSMVDSFCKRAETVYGKSGGAVAGSHAGPHHG
jgi:ribosome-associated toxin RatA of RatAB toxin-antitoxin module